MKRAVEGFGVILAAIIVNYGVALLYDLINDAIFSGVGYPVYAEAGGFVASAIENGKLLASHAQLVVESFFAAFGEGSLAEFFLALALAASMLIVASVYNVLAFFVMLVAILGNVWIFFLE